MKNFNIIYILAILLFFPQTYCSESKQTFMQLVSAYVQQFKWVQDIPGHDLKCVAGCLCGTAIVNPPATPAVCCAYTAATVLYLYGAAKENEFITQQPKQD